MSVLSLFIYFIVGCLSSFISGLLGVGGGIILIPALVIFFSTFNVIPAENIMHLSIGTSLACSIINLVVAVREHAKRKAVQWSIFASMTPGVIVGALIIGPQIMVLIHGNYLKIFFGLFCLALSIKMLFDRKTSTEQKPMPSRFVMTILGICIGSLSTLLGIAGGAFVGATLHHYQMNARYVVATTAAICFVIAIAGTIGVVFMSYGLPDLPPYSTGYIYWPAVLSIIIPSPLIAPLGVSLAHKISTSVLRKLFAGLMLLIGIKMIL